MTYIITEPCIEVKDASCVEVCPVDCIYEGERMYFIHPTECIECGMCESICPVDAIRYDDPALDGAGHVTFFPLATGKAYSMPLIGVSPYTWMGGCPSVVWTRPPICRSGAAILSIGRVFGHTMCDEVYRVITGHVLLLQEICRVAFTLGKDRDQNVRAGDFVAAGAFNM